MAKDKTDKELSSLETLMELDKKISLSLSLSASKDSPLGHFRPHMKGLELSCHGLFWICGCWISLWFTKDPVKEAFFFNMLLALFLDIVLVCIFKALISRSRPSNNESEDMFMTWSVDKMSCPSGHTSRSILLMLILVASSPHLILLHPFIIVWSLATCASRVLLGRHYLGDVIVGALLGVVEYYIMCYVWAGPETTKWYLDFFGDTEILSDEL